MYKWQNVYVLFPDKILKIVPYISYLKPIGIKKKLTFAKMELFIVHQGLCVTYLCVYVYDNISKDNNSKFPKSPNSHF